MRQQHQKSRGRGRGRKPQNPMSRNFESNGPDVKIRGNASHIAEKYSALARDCLSNGDRVVAENYLQHAEHYNRIVAAAQLQNAAKAEENQNANGKGPQPEVEGKTSEGDGSEAAASEAPAGEDQNQAEKADRKTGRTKRSRRNETEDQPAAKADSGSDDQDATDEIISDDAAKLPESITGGLAVEEG